MGKYIFITFILFLVFIFIERREICRLIKIGDNNKIEKIEPIPEINSKNVLRLFATIPACPKADISKAFYYNRNVIVIPAKLFQ